MYMDYDKSVKESLVLKSSELQNSIKAIETIDIAAEHLPNIKTNGSSEIFHTKRLFNNFKSKNESTKKNYENTMKMKGNNSESNLKNNIDSIDCK